MTRNKDTLRDRILILLKGFFMGIADIIPGVSGGTIALITGVYERFIKALGNINLNFIPHLYEFIKRKDRTYLTHIRRDFKRMDIFFLINIGLGILLAIALGSLIIPHLMETYTAFVYAFFFGLILASVKLILQRKQSKNARHHFVSGILGFLAGVIVVSIQSLQSSHTILFTFLCGSVAITAMLLPGISGSFILLILGQYKFMLEVLHNLKENILFFLAFAVGALAGLLVFSRIISWGLKHYHDYVILFLTGLMLGSLKLPLTKIIESSPAKLELMFVVFFLILGIGVILLIEKKVKTS